MSMETQRRTMQNLARCSFTRPEHRRENDLGVASGAGAATRASIVLAERLKQAGRSGAASAGGLSLLLLLLLLQLLCSLLEGSHFSSGQISMEGSNEESERAEARRREEKRELSGSGQGMGIFIHSLPENYQIIQLIIFL